MSGGNDFVYDLWKGLPVLWILCDLVDTYNSPKSNTWWTSFISLCYSRKNYSYMCTHDWIILQPLDNRSQNSCPLWFINFSFISWRNLFSIPDSPALKKADLRNIYNYFTKEYSYSVVKLLLYDNNQSLQQSNCY